MRRLRAVLGWGLALAAAVLPGIAAAQTWDPAEAIRQAGWVWAAPEQFDLQGAQVSLQRFQAPGDPAHAARRLAAVSEGRLTRLQLDGTALFLSGGRGAEHWLAQVQPGAEGTIGLVSRLVPVAAASAAFDPVSLAPAGARRMLQMSSRPPADLALLSSFDCPGTVTRVAAAVGQALQAARWSVADLVQNADYAAGADVSLPAQWRHPDGSRLSVHLHPRRQSVGLTFLYRPKESS
ncbi:MAG: hypothetical protein WBF69_01500 [Castellaniella sp.]|uniref:hypothetical protein n=1 Tax=Castellaniella sp. TaxID=1955812 RepID=UPI003C71373C